MEIVILQLFDTVCELTTWPPESIFVKYGTVEILLRMCHSGEQSNVG